MALVTAIVVTSAVTVAASQKQARNAARAQEKAQKIDQKRQNVQMAREKRKQIRQARQAQATVANQAFAQGTAQTSKTAQISAGITGEAASNVSFLDNQQSFVQAIGKQNLISSQAQAKAARITAIGGVVQSGLVAGARFGGGGGVDTSVGPDGVGPPMPRGR